MTQLSNQELEARLAGIQVGPWSKGVAKARRALAPVADLHFDWDARLLSLDKVILSAANKRKSAQLQKVLRPHYKGKPIKSMDEIETREAFDDALTIPQLYELAIQTGYLPEDSVKDSARSFATDFLWSVPARAFVQSYDYIVVPMLAARFGISGFPATRPPQTNPHSTIRFAGFLAHLRAFYSDDQIEVWLGFLDDYVVKDNEQDLLWEYLRGRRTTPPKRYPALLTGCQRFVTSLSTAFHLLGEDELGRYGLMHSYWLQKFFGFKRNLRGEFVKNIQLWGEKDSWAQTFCESSSPLSQGVEHEIQDLTRRQFAEQVALLKRTFDAVKQLVNETRQPIRKPQRSISDRPTVSSAE